jgi:hypothetical protein
LLPELRRRLGIRNQLVDSLTMSEDLVLSVNRLRVIAHRRAPGRPDNDHHERKRKQHIQNMTKWANRSHLTKFELHEPVFGLKVRAVK